jgi:hypothetical protein
MRSLHVLRRVTLAIGVLAGVVTSAAAQTVAPAPTTQIAPGGSAPPYSMGGVGPGNVPIAPGIGISGTAQIGPGGTMIAPGLAGQVSGTSPMSTPAMPTRRVR